MRPESTTVWLWIVANAIVALGALMAAINRRDFPTIVAATSTREQLDVLIAMRDEARNARACVLAVLAAANVRRVIVVDDGSTDGTIGELQSIDDERLTAIARDCGGKGAALAFARASLGADARSWLLFLDADVRLSTDAADALIAHARSQGVESVTVWPRVVAPSIWSALLSPYLTATLLQALPMRAARGSDPRFAAGNGACFLVDRDAYDRCGGHARIDAVVEDVALARALKRHGARIALASGARIATIAGYDGYLANVRGYGRSLYAGAGVAGCVAFGLWQLLACCAPLPLYIGRAVGAIAMREAWWSVALAPVGSLLAALGAVIAAVEGVTGRLRWRGRALDSGESRSAHEPSAASSDRHRRTRCVR